jgi:chromosome segregation protein
VGPKRDEERRTYAEHPVEKCREICLQSVVITDRHDLTDAEIIRAAAAPELAADGNPLPEKYRLIVFPGVELTLAVPCQVLLTLDATTA